MTYVPNQFGGTLASISALASPNLISINTDHLTNHYTYFISSVKSYYQLDKNRADTPDGYVIVQPISGAGRWIRTNFTDGYWALQTIWYIDPINGHDEYDGTSATHTSGLVGPTKSWAEVVRRIGDTKINQNVTFNIINNLSNENLFIPFKVDGSVLITVQGTLHQITTGTVGTARPRSASTRTPNGITPTGGAFNWSTYVAANAIVVGTGGSINGAWAYVMKDEGSSIGRLSSFLDSNESEKTLANGQTYSINSLVTIPRLDITSTCGIFKIKNVCLKGGHHISNTPFDEEPTVGPSFFSVNLEGCIINRTDSVSSDNWRTEVIFFNCLFIGDSSNFGTLFGSETRTFLAGGFVSASSSYLIGLINGAKLALFHGTLFQNVATIIDEDSSIFCIDGMFFDLPSTTLFGAVSAAIDIQVGSLHVYTISGNAGSGKYGVQLHDPNSAIKLYLQNTQYLTGNSGDILTPGANVLVWSNVQSGYINIDGTLAAITRFSATTDWSKQTTWYIDPVNGNDGYTGSVSSFTSSLTGPLKTLTELIRRLQNAFINQATTINILNNISATDVVPWILRCGSSGFIKFKGSRSSLFSGTISAIQNLNRTSNLETRATSTWTVASLLNKLAILSSNGASAWIAADLGSNVARLSPWVTTDDSSPTTVLNHPTQVNASVSGTVTVYSLPTMPLDIDVLCDIPTNGGANIVFEDLNFTAVNNSRLSTNGTFAALRCDLTNARIVNGRIIASSCRQNGGTISSRATPIVFTNYAGLVTADITINYGGTYIVDDDTLAQGTANGIAFVSPFGNIEIGNACAFDNGWTLTVQCSTCRITGVIWGVNTGNSGPIQIIASRATYTTKPIQQVGNTASGDIIIGGTPKTFADLPYIETANNSMLVYEQ